jgi:Outer membrane protein beta-barrel domain
MQHLYLLTFTLMTFVGFAQRTPNEVQAGTFKRFEIGISASPEICYRTLLNNDGSQNSTSIINYRNENETVKMGYTGGLHLGYNFNERFGFQTGIQYANRGFSTKKIDIAGSLMDPVIPESLKYNYNYHYLEIPAKVNFSFGENQIRLTTSAGLSSAFLIKQSRTFIGYYKDTTTRQVFISNDAYNRFNLFATISAGLEMRFNPIMSIKVEPTFRYGLLKITDTPVSGHWYSGGLNVSYLVRL